MLAKVMKRKSDGSFSIASEINYWNSLPWVWLMFEVIGYFAFYSRINHGGTRLIIIMLVSLAGFCFGLNIWEPFIILGAILYIVPNPTDNNIIVPIVFILLWLFLKIHFWINKSSIRNTRSESAWIALILITVGFFTSFPANTTERYNETIMRMLRFVALFGAIRFLIKHFVRRDKVRYCIYIIAGTLALYYTLLVYLLSHTVVVDNIQLDSVQGNLEFGSRSMILPRTAHWTCINNCVLYTLGIMFNRKKYYTQACLFVSMGSRFMRYSFYWCTGCIGE